MSDQKWLWDQPQSWHAVNRALLDIGVLLNYLNELPDARLMSYFSETDGAANPQLRAATPPCDRYSDFLNGVAAVSAAFQTGTKPPEMPPGRGGTAPLDPVAFVNWSYNFLAAVAAPATASSIRLTRAFAMCRSRGLWTRLRALFCPSLWEAARETPQPQSDPEEHAQEQTARWLARWYWQFELVTLVMVVVTLMASIYALSGRLILTSETALRDQWAKLDASIETEEVRIFPSPVMPVAEPTVQFPAHHLCELKGPIKPDRVQLAAAEPSQVPASGADGDTKESFLSVRQAHLCNQNDKLQQDLYLVTMHLQLWSSVIAGREHDEGETGWWLTSWPPPLLSDLFGIRGSTLSQDARERDGGICGQVAPQMKAKNSLECERVLWTLVGRTENVAQSILGSITQYVLPVCYGFLGAMAAAFRLMRRKMDAATVAATDRARLQQGAILGVLCGAVIGLFANQLGGANEPSGLGLSALALIAGYNVDGVFRFLDELSERVFGSGAKAK
jgi:hypothetical protein